MLQLVDAGRVSLDDSVAEHLPEFRPADPRGADITVRQLLDQTSGLADREVHELNRRQPATLAEATISLNSARLVAAPGRRFNYHNPNYHVAARLVEVVRGETFEKQHRKSSPPSPPTAAIASSPTPPTPRSISTRLTPQQPARPIRDVVEAVRSDKALPPN